MKHTRKEQDLMHNKAYVTKQVSQKQDIHEGKQNCKLHKRQGRSPKHNMEVWYHLVRLQRWNRAARHKRQKHLSTLQHARTRLNGSTTDSIAKMSGKAIQAQHVCMSLNVSHAARNHSQSTAYRNSLHHSEENQGWMHDWLEQVSIHNTQRWYCWQSTTNSTQYQRMRN